MPCLVLVLFSSISSRRDRIIDIILANTTRHRSPRERVFFVPATLSLFITTWHDAYGGGFFMAFRRRLRSSSGLGWVGRGGLDGSSYEGGDYRPECVLRSDFVWTTYGQRREKTIDTQLHQCVHPFRHIEVTVLFVLIQSKHIHTRARRGLCVSTKRCNQLTRVSTSSSSRYPCSPSPLPPLARPHPACRRRQP
jgi:hypothetical protein